MLVFVLRGAILFIIGPTKPIGELTRIAKPLESN